MYTTLGARTARRYADQFGWSIVRGHFATEEKSAMPCCCGASLPSSRIVCSCGAPRCATPGCHPVADGWVEEASSDADTLTRLWDGQQWWPIALTGLEFDAVVVAGPLSAEVLSQPDASLGLTITWRDDWHAFLTAPAVFNSNLVGDREGVSLRGKGNWIPLPAAALLSPARWISTPSRHKSSLVFNEIDAVLTMLPSESHPGGSEVER